MKQLQEVLYLKIKGMDIHDIINYFPDTAQFDTR